MNGSINLINIVGFYYKLIIAYTISRLREFLDSAITNGKTIGFVPTMGALHPGHKSLIERARVENELVVCSIFVNPTQFNDPKDLINYPRTPELDYAVLEESGCDIVFSPSVEEMYPDDRLLDLNFGDLETVMEGHFRPGHFKGVATVVSRLFSITTPTRAYFGEKDFQQLAVIREMNRRLKTGIEIVSCATLREADGLAMSSRNIHLNHAERNNASVIYKALIFTQNAVHLKELDKIKEEVHLMIEQFDGFKVQYFELVDSYTLQPISKWESTKEQRACIAVLTSKTRLIDNIAL